MTTSPEPTPPPIQHLWRLSRILPTYVTWCGEDAELWIPSSTEESNAVPVCTPCHRELQKAQAPRLKIADQAIHAVAALGNLLDGVEEYEQHRKPRPEPEPERPRACAHPTCGHYEVDHDRTGACTQRTADGQRPCECPGWAGA